MSMFILIKCRQTVETVCRQAYNEQEQAHTHAHTNKMNMNMLR